MMAGEVLGWSGVDAAIADAPMTAQRRFGLAPSRPPISSAFPVDVAVLALRDHEQLAVRLGPTKVGAAPQHSMRPAEGSDNVRRTTAAAPGTGDRAGNTKYAAQPEWRSLETASPAG